MRMSLISLPDKAFDELNELVIANKAVDEHVELMVAD
jgi:hypothetical protein